MPLHPREHPIGFTLHNMQGEPTLTLTSGEDGQMLHLTLINRGEQALTLPAGSSFQLLTRAGFLTGADKITVEAVDGWQFGALLTWTTTRALTLSGRLMAGDRVRFKLAKVRIDPAFAAHTSRVELKYNLPAVQAGFREQALSVVHHLGKKVLPLHVGIVGPRTILNNGQVNRGNAIRLRLTNTGREPLSFYADSTFTFSFDVDDSANKGVAWALSTAAAVRTVQVTLPDGTAAVKDPQSKVPVFIAKPYAAPASLPVGEYLDFVFDNFSTAHPSGETNLYIDYRDIPGYWDSRLVVALQKAPLLFMGDYVGIGTADPTAKLDVAGAIKAGNSDLYFSKTDHTHTGFGNASGHAAIENAQDYNALMILGRATDSGRRVRLWDYLEVNGPLEVTGHLRANGSIEAGNSDLYFSKTDHTHTGFGNAPGHAAIENAQDYNALMILGRSAAQGFGRRVRLWDYLEVNGPLDVQGSVRIRTSDRLYFGEDRENTDPIYFERTNDRGDRSVLHLVLGDNPVGDPNMDSFVIETRNIDGSGAQSRFFFNSDGNAFKAGTQPGWGTISDCRAKHDVQPLAGSLDRVLNLHGKSFYYNDPQAIGAAPGHRTGFIAQEVEAVFPEWVGQLDGMKTLTIGGGSFEALMVEALRELRAEKDAEIEELKRQVERLTDRTLKV
jgi:hypothetical protein